MDYTKRFDGKGEIYAKARPKYSLALFDYLKNTLHIPQNSILLMLAQVQEYSQSNY